MHHVKISNRHTRRQTMPANNHVKHLLDQVSRLFDRVS